VVVESVAPEIHQGRFAIKRTIGESVKVRALVFADGHDLTTCQLLYRPPGAESWLTGPMAPIGNDTWEGQFSVTALGRHLYTVRAWTDHFLTWRAALQKRIAAGQELSVELRIGAQFVDAAAARALAEDASRLRQWAEALRSGAAALADSEDLLATMARYPDLSLATTYEPQLPLVVDRAESRFSAWYEFFPRSASSEPGQHGTFRDAERLLPYIASMGFDVVYLPPIHPIGLRFRKGKNNVPEAQPGDVGSPWAIGDATGGHTAIHPSLGTLADFQSFLAAARSLHLDVALDIAFQCSPDHPWARNHPEWFRQRPDGSIQCAENPPKKYQDIYPLDFETPAWHELWAALKNVFDFWIAQGIRIFRVDNPHTKPFAFWEWCIASLQEEHPDLLFLAEAFTRPHVMHRLAQLGFSQSYTYFPWRNTKRELTYYFTELISGEPAEYFRPSLWLNTPDILPEMLQVGGRPAFMLRLLLAATLGASYGIYGPAFELGENTPKEAGSEEYRNSEKYEIKHWDLDSPHSMRHFIARLNRIRRENPALHRNASLTFHETDNPNIICYSKTSEDRSNVIIVVVNLDWAHTQSGWVTINTDVLDFDSQRPFEAEDLLSGGRFLWQAPRDYVELAPLSLPGHIFRVRRWMRTERDFDYYD
jgi:starch synthase (maltosyl-transferring)